MMWIGLYLLIGLVLALIAIVLVGIHYKSFLNFAIEEELSEGTIRAFREKPVFTIMVLIIVCAFLWPYITYASLRGEKS